MDPATFDDSTYEEPPPARTESMRDLLTRMSEKCPGFDGLVLDWDEEPSAPLAKPPPVDLVLIIDGKEVIRCL